jgi:hypothetical protein
MVVVEIKKNKLGWGGVVRFTSRPYAVFVDGSPLTTKAGTIRTFGDRAAARKAADRFLAGQSRVPEGARDV